MPTINRFEDLEVWQLARTLYEKMSAVAAKLKKIKEYRFAEQVRSASGSIMDNIAEGFERNSRLEFINALGISKGECGEIRSQLYRLSIDQYISDKEFSELYEHSDKLSKKIANFMIYLNNSVIRGLKFKNRRIQ